MELASQLVIGLGALVLGLATVWFGMPKKAEIPRFLRSAFMEMVYPVTTLMFLVFGVAALLGALW